MTLDVDYDESTIYSMDQLVFSLRSELARHVQDGGLSPSGEEVVDGWDMEIEEYYD
jgi:hypothetical protein